MDPVAAQEAALQIRSRPSDLFIVAIGEDPDVSSLVKMASPPVENNVFMTTTPNALQAHLRALTDTVCKGGRRGSQFLHIFMNTNMVRRVVKVRKITNVVFGALSI